MFRNIGEIGLPTKILAYRLKISLVVKSIFWPHLNGLPENSGVRQLLIYLIHRTKEIDSVPIQSLKQIKISCNNTQKWYYSVNLASFVSGFSESSFYSVFGSIVARGFARGPVSLCGLNLQHCISPRRSSGPLCSYFFRQFFLRPKQRPNPQKDLNNSRLQERSSNGRSARYYRCSLRPELMSSSRAA